MPLLAKILFLPLQILVTHILYTLIWWYDDSKLQAVASTVSTISFFFLVSFSKDKVVKQFKVSYAR